MRLSVIFIFIFSIFIFSCEVTDQTKTGMLQANRWRLFSLKEGNVKIDCSCLADDCYLFAAGGSYTIDPGQISCADNDAAGGTYWMYDEETIAMNSNGNRLYYKIFFYDGSLILIRDNNGTMLTYTYVPC